MIIDYKPILNIIVDMYAGQGPRKAVLMVQKKCQQLRLIWSNNIMVTLYYTKKFEFYNFF